MDTMQTPIVNELSRMSAIRVRTCPQQGFADRRTGDRCAHRAEGEPIARQVAPRAPGS
jgi:hypothetical protein